MIQAQRGALGDVNLSELWKAGWRAAGGPVWVRPDHRDESDGGQPQAKVRPQAWLKNRGVVSGL